MCAPSAPAAPDYKGAAETTANSQRINQYTPYGNLIYSQTPESQQAQQQWQQQGQSQPQPQLDTSRPIYGGREGSDVVGYEPARGQTSFQPQGPRPEASYQSTMTLNPEAQKTLDAQMRASTGVSSLMDQQVGRVQDQYAQPMDLSSVQDVADKSYAAQTARLDPQWQQREEMQRTQLANQGLSSGGEAYGNAMRDFGQQRNDAYQQANLAAIQTMPQTYQLASSAYNQPLNTLNALRTGSQIQNPQFGGAGQPTNYANAAQQQGAWQQGLFNADMGAYNSQLSGAAMLGAAMISDRRLKRNVERVGTHPLGIGIYEYDIFDRHEYGVMADELLTIMPEAVVERPDGYLAVRYDMIGGRPHA